MFLTTSRQSVLLNSPKGILSTISVAIARSLEGSDLDLVLFKGNSAASYALFCSEIFSDVGVDLVFSGMESDLLWPLSLAVIFGFGFVLAL